MLPLLPLAIVYLDKFSTLFSVCASYDEGNSREDIMYVTNWENINAVVPNFGEICRVVAAQFQICLTGESNETLFNVTEVVHYGF